MGDIKSALDSITVPIDVSAPTKAKVYTQNEIIAINKKVKSDNLAKARAIKEANRQEKIKADPKSSGKVTYKKTAEFNNKIDKLNYLDSIIEKLDKIEDKMKLKEPIIIKDDQPLKTEKEPEEIKVIEQKLPEQMVESLKEKDPLKIDDRVKPEDTIKPPDAHKVFDGYNVRRYTSLKDVPKFKLRKN